MTQDSPVARRATCFRTGCIGRREWLCGRGQRRREDDPEPDHRGEVRTTRHGRASRGESPRSDSAGGRVPEVSVCVCVAWRGVAWSGVRHARAASHRDARACHGQPRHSVTVQLNLLSRLPRRRRGPAWLQRTLTSSARRRTTCVEERSGLGGARDVQRRARAGGALVARARGVTVVCGCARAPGTLRNACRAHSWRGGAVVHARARMCVRACARVAMRAAR